MRAELKDERSGYILLPSAFTSPHSCFYSLLKLKEAIYRLIRERKKNNKQPCVWMKCGIISIYVCKCVF